MLYIWDIQPYSHLLFMRWSPIWTLYSLLIPLWNLIDQVFFFSYPIAPTSHIKKCIHLWMSHLTGHVYTCKNIASYKLMKYCRTKWKTDTSDQWRVLVKKACKKLKTIALCLIIPPFIMPRPCEISAEIWCAIVKYLENSMRPVLEYYCLSNYRRSPCTSIVLGDGDIRVFSRR